VREVENYGGFLADKPRVTVLNKIDTLDEEEREFIRDEIEAAPGTRVMLMSGISREGGTDVLRALRAQIDEDRLRQKIGDEEPEEWQP
jgi:GTP-binding protein